MIYNATQRRRRTDGRELSAATREKFSLCVLGQEEGSETSGLRETQSVISVPFIPPRAN